MPKSSDLFTGNEEYAALLNDLKQRIRSSQVKAALAVNKELLFLYWQIGCDILARQQAEGWGSKVIDRLAQDLKQAFPALTGFSPRNLKYMRAFAEAWPDETIVLQVAAQIPWGHNQQLLNKLDSQEQRLWYAQKTLEHGWSRNILVTQIETSLFERKGGAVTNFAVTLPQPQSDLAQNLIKDPYHLDFLTVNDDIKEQDLRQALVKHMRDFLLELGVGFAFIGSNYHLNVCDEDFYLDMLFYHMELRCFVIIDLKMGEFKPEYSGQMNFYISAINDQMRKAQDQPTIGIILCKSRKKTIAEYALGNLRNPIAVATHELPQQLQQELPSAKRLQTELDNAVQKIVDEGPTTTNEPET